MTLRKRRSSRRSGRLPAASPMSPEQRRAAFRTGMAEPGAPYKLSDAEVERSLVTGENSELLRRYFGEAQQQELQDLARQAASQSVRGGPRVWILPGIMGSKLGSPRLLFDDVVWIEPVDIAQGDLMDLALLPGPPRHQALGVMLFTYLKLKLQLVLAGYHADFYPFDWRNDIAALGRHFARTLESEGSHPISIVAHSLGGLVARAALKHLPQRNDRLIMLGTPNYGTFAVTQALRGIYPIIRRLALLDLQHNPETLTERVFNTFPGLYQMLPAAEKWSGLDLFTRAGWPGHGPQPRAELLRLAQKTPAFLAPPCPGWTLIAGVNQETVVGLELDKDGFQYHISNEGDGTVPLALAQLEGVPTYYAETAHGSLPNDGQVIKAVREVLAQGQTAQLPQQWSPGRSAGKRTIDETTVRNTVPSATDAPRGAAVRDQEMREILREVAAPDPGPELGSVPVPASGFAHPFESITVGRQRQRRLDLRLALGSITEVTSSAYVLGLFRDVTPSGPARAIDLELNGAIAEFSRRRMFSGNVGEVFMLPTGGHLLRADTVLFAGLGSFDTFTDEILQLVAENVIRTFVTLGIHDFATVAIGGGSGRTVEGSLRNLLIGFFRGLGDTERGHDFRRITLCERDPEQFAKVKEELFRLASTDLFRDVEVTFEETVLAASPERVPVRVGLGATGAAPVYLLVRQERAHGGTLEYSASLLTAGRKAAVITLRHGFARKTLDTLLKQIESPSFTFERLPAFGMALAKLVLPPDLLQVLTQIGPSALVVVHDAATSRVPWETICLQGWSPAVDSGLSRKYLAENLSVAKWLEERLKKPELHLLLIVNPTGDLDGAEAEGERVRELFGAHSNIQVTERHQDHATKTTLLDDFRSGRFDVIHYAGHAFFDPQRPAHSGIVCSGQEILGGADLTGLANLPSLMFFNACEAGRIRRWSGARNKLFTLEKRIEQSVGLAEAFLRAGVANYLGTHWPVGDAPAKEFAEVFYVRLLAGDTLGDALLAGRRAVRRLKSVDWADYLLYGSPEFALKQK